MKVLDRLARMLALIILSISIAVILAPVVVTVFMSFSSSRLFSFPPPGFGWRQYQELFANPLWLDSLGLSISLALPAALLAVILATPVALVSQRSRLPGRNIVQGVAVGTLIVPVSALAVGIFSLFAHTGLTGTNLGLVIAQTVLASPVALVTISAALAKTPREPEYAAMVSGAGRLRAILEITGRALVPALFASLIMGFLLAFNEVVIVNFVGGPDQITLPKAIFDSVQYSIDPVITAVAAFMMAGSAVLMGLILVVDRLVNRRSKA